VTRAPVAAMAETVTITRAQYERLLWAQDYVDRQRARSRRWHERKHDRPVATDLRPVATSSGDRPEAMCRPVALSLPGRPGDMAKNGHRPVAASSAGRPDKGALGVKAPVAYDEEYEPPTPPLFRPAGEMRRVDEVVDLITATGQAPPVLKRADRRAISTCSAPTTLIADAFVAARRGAWGGKWLRQNLSLSAVVRRLDGYIAAQSPPEISDRPGPPLVLVTD
jgi:hypothetical protein